ncbi:MAG: hypothetical protein KBS81_02845, partial [Spirochaetales bacterium]|nr:hypothetical protein [Candidatus Physcosoma equi]
MEKEGLYRLAEKKEWQMMLSLSIPVVLSLCVQGLYGIADSIYVSRLGEYALSAVSLATVVQNFCTYFFSGIATGMNAVLSESLGQNNPKRARNALLNGAFVQAAFVALFTLVGVFGSEAIFRFSSKDAEVVLNGVRYLRPILLL